ncbi:molybdopterin oxidoreductase family protein [Pandoraea nosoerga]|uniref:Molybdopterin oxidoreductase n=1 Tax=Pandoraea nosoerga TaxID=2508296 RepID=A0A5E4XPG9_9BURK|nr:molybdopterin oxidoreductase family protein [Pandoraea nosoerga]MBN4664052.1 molybdopterin oxidoreductase family protein [Pandoraea nosoerga]MBN4675536.1 molybdopterin oxidoreductase family protein [Pandoraea nosoerga]MBN4679141.1 molybdopterin oxidoreductase family protein [Pandoraea nosoerga]MBN4743860.1 molybdopterin oxidoreductase family protein [Pandoraea nosoerga]VVE38035.1 molybdopterin oxidoreductase [Pandoraea nosoerga]
MTTEAHVVRAACPHDCPDTCALHVTVENGVAIKVQGDPDHPTTKGVLCTKVARYTERTYHPERLLHPLKRVGPKGSGQFVRVSWDEALDEIAARLGAIAAREPEAILPYSYAGTMGFVQGESMAARFFNKIGASELDRTICASAGAAGMRYTYGAGVGMHVEHFVDSKLILIWGSNPITSSVHFWAIAQEAKRRGAKLIAIDPYRSLTAEKCHQHIALLPGTDAALALGMMHVLINEDLVDHEYIARHTVGYPQLKERVRRYTPSRVAEICGISEDVIIALAREYASVRPAAIRLNYGMQRVRGGGQATRAIACLPALIGAWRDPAGGLLMSTSGFAPVDGVAQARPDLRPRQDRPPRVVNMSAIGDALCHPGGGTFGPKIEAVIVYNSNPVAVAPESAKVAEGFGRDDLFTVVLEHFQTDTADYADFVLPATTQLEHLDIHKAYGHTYLLANNPAIAPLGEAKPNSEIFRLLAKRMGWQEPCFSDTDDDLAAQSIRWNDARMAGSSWEQLKRDGWIRYDLPEAPFANGQFYTPSGKCEFYSERMLEEGFDPLPDWVPPYESAASNPALAERYPLAMISPPARNFLNSSFVNVDSLRASVGEPTLDIHPSDAAPRGIADGDIVKIFNDRGTLNAKARVTDRAREGVVVGLSIWWKKLAPDGKNANEVTSQQLTDLGRAPTFYDCLVDVAPL